MAEQTPVPVYGLVSLVTEQAALLVERLVRRAHVALKELPVAERLLRSPDRVNAAFDSIRWPAAAR